jgi:hypothetical protein
MRNPGSHRMRTCTSCMPGHVKHVESHTQHSMLNLMYLRLRSHCMPVVTGEPAPIPCQQVFTEASPGGAAVTLRGETDTTACLRGRQSAQLGAGHAAHV